MKCDSGVAARRRCSRIFGPTVLVPGQHKDSPLLVLLLLLRPNSMLSSYFTTNQNKAKTKNEIFITILFSFYFGRFLKVRKNIIKLNVTQAAKFGLSSAAILINNIASPLANAKQENC